MSRRDVEPEDLQPEPDSDIVCPAWLVRAVVALAVFGILATATLIAGIIYLYQTNQFGPRLACEIFDTLPQGGVLETARERYDCARDNGVPINELPPELQERYAPPPEPRELTESQGAAPGDPWSGAVEDPYRVPVGEPPND